MSLPRTDSALEQIEDAIARNHGSLPAACGELGIKPHALHMWMQADPTVYNRLRAAQLFGYSTLEAVAIDRAVNGVTEDVWYKGEVVGTKQNYSDGLLQTVLKARVPEYGTDENVHRGLTVNVAIMPRASNYEEWLLHRDQALAIADKSNSPSDSSPEVEEAEYVDVNEAHTTGLRDVL